MGDVRGTAVKVQWVPETTYKTPGAVGEQLNVLTCGVRPSRARVRDDTLSGFRGQARTVGGAIDVTGPITGVIAPEDIGILLKNLIGAPTTTGAGPYTHVFQPASSGANALPVGGTLQYDYGAAIDPASRFLRLFGCRIGQGTFNFTPDGMQTYSLDLTGADWLQHATDLDATPVVRGHTAFEAANLAVVLGGGSPLNICFNSMSLVVSNDLDTDKRCISAGGVRDGLPEGFVMVSGQATMFFDHEDVIDQVLSGNDTELQITLSRGTGLGTAGNESLVWHVGDLVFDQTAPVLEGPKGLRLQANFNAHRIGTSEIDFLTTLKNQISAIS